jgi:hypothetical protein
MNEETKQAAELTVKPAETPRTDAAWDAYKRGACGLAYVEYQMRQIELGVSILSEQLADAQRSAEDARRDSELLQNEMRIHLPVLENAENNPEIWGRITRGTGIATLNVYRAAMAARLSGGMGDTKP